MWLEGGLPPDQQAQYLAARYAERRGVSCSTRCARRGLRTRIAAHVRAATLVVTRCRRSRCGVAGVVGVVGSAGAAGTVVEGVSVCAEALNGFRTVSANDALAMPNAVMPVVTTFLIRCTFRCRCITGWWIHTGIMRFER